MSPAPRHTLVVAVHAVDALTRLREDQFVDSVLAHLALETMSVVRVVTSHDSFVEDGLFADIAAVRTVRTYRRSVREQQEVRVRGDLVAALGALETVDMEEGLSGERDYRRQYREHVGVGDDKRNAQGRMSYERYIEGLRSPPRSYGEPPHSTINPSSVTNVLWPVKARL